MSNSNPSATKFGEEKVVELTQEQSRFIRDFAFAHLNKVKDTDQLKHFAEMWWNLCQWEKQRLDILDSKAQMLLGLSGIATAILGTGIAQQPSLLRACAAVAFLLTMISALVALFVKKVGGFLDYEVFEALSANTSPVGVTPKFRDGDKVNCYYREIVLQRWFVYDQYKKASEKKSPWVKCAQFMAVGAISLAAAALVAATNYFQGSAAQQTTNVAAPLPGPTAASAPAPAASSTAAPIPAAGKQASKP